MFWQGGSVAQGGRRNRPQPPRHWGRPGTPLPAATRARTPAPLTRTLTRLYLCFILLHACIANDFLNVIRVEVANHSVSRICILLLGFDPKYVLWELEEIVFVW